MKPRADLVLHEGRIAGHCASDSVAVGDGRIIAHGRFDDLRRLCDTRTRVVCLGGRTVAPGFIDSHLHFLAAAAALGGCSVDRCRTLRELLEELRVAANATPQGRWLRASGCDEALLAERRGPTLEELDAAAPNNPLRLRHLTLHASWLNSRAIAALGLDAAGFSPPEGARLIRDAAGRMTGMMIGMEQWIGGRLPATTTAETEARARVLSRRMAAVGVTAFTDATVRNTAADAAMFEGLTTGGAVVQRVAMMIGAEALETVDRWPVESAIRAAGVKFMPGGSGGADHAAGRMASALGLGLDCAYHATEVEELDEALSAFELALKKTAPDHMKGAFRIEHGGVIPPNYVERIRAIGAWVVTNPGFIHYRGAKYATEAGLAEYLYPARILAEAGVCLAGASDAPVTPALPLTAIAAARSRLSFEQIAIGPSQRLGAERALALFTADGARLARLRAGAIAPGNLADLIVLDADPFALAPEDLMRIRVDMTIVGGKVVYVRHGQSMERARADRESCSI